MQHLRLSLFWVIFLAGAAVGFAHPHIIIDYDVELRLDARGRAIGYYVSWTFDPLFSQEVIYETDRNRDGRLQAEEVDLVRAYAFDNTRHYNYFTAYRPGGQVQIQPERVEEFWAEVVGRQITYRFFVPFSRAAIESIARTGSVSVWVSDPTYFSAFFPKNPPVLPVRGVDFHVVKDSSSPIEYAAQDTGGPLSSVLPERIDFSLGAEQ